MEQWNFSFDTLAKASKNIVCTFHRICYKVGSINISNIWNDSISQIAQQTGCKCQAIKPTRPYMVLNMIQKSILPAEAHHLRNARSRHSNGQTIKKQVQSTVQHVQLSKIFERHGRPCRVWTPPVSLQTISQIHGSTWWSLHSGL